jgi:hypothetical protein
MNKTDIRDLRRILALTVIKDNPDDTPHDSLSAIGHVVSRLLYRHDAFHRALQDKKQEARNAEESERRALWDELA